MCRHANLIWMNLSTPSGGVESLLQEPEAKADEAEPSGEDAEQEDGQDKFTLPPMETMPETTLEGAADLMRQTPKHYIVAVVSAEYRQHKILIVGLTSVHSGLIL